MSGDAVDEFRERFAEALTGGAREFVIDMSGVKMADPSGMGVLVRCHANLHAPRPTHGDRGREREHPHGAEADPAGKIVRVLRR